MRAILLALVLVLVGSVGCERKTEPTGDTTVPAMTTPETAPKVAPEAVPETAPETVPAGN